MTKVRPKKSLGQHFLNDESIAERIANTVDLVPQLPILEIGPGMGVLTKYLIQKKRSLKAVELDNESVSYLQKYFPEIENDIIRGDFLKLDVRDIFSSEFCLIGNYPYNISSQIFFKLIENRDIIPFCSGMVQKEVIQRIAAPPGSKTYGILSVLLQAWYDVEYLFTVDGNAFTPPPKVKSGVFTMKRNDRQQLSCDEGLFKIVVKTAFNQRRKMLRNSLKSLLNEDTTFEKSEFAQKRPEQLSVSEFERLTNFISGIDQKNK